MPTNDDNGASPTDFVNADSGFDVTTIPTEMLESHPYIQELKKKNAAAHSKMDESNLSKKQIQAELAKYKTLAGEEELPEEEDESPYVTKAELWEDRNSKDIEVFGDEEYLRDIEQGIPKAYALKTAKLRYGNSSPDAQVLRQKSMASAGSTSTRDISDIEITDQDRADQAIWKYSTKAMLKQKALKKARGQ